MIPVDAILFDLDGTLIDSKSDICRSVQFVQKDLGEKPSTEEEISAFVGDGVRKLIQRALPARQGEDLTEAVARFLKHYREHCLDQTRLCPGVRETLAHFHPKKMAVVTNKTEELSQRILEGLGVSSYFSLVLGGDSLTERKPHPGPIQHALQFLDVKNSRRVLIVGDSANDIAAGRAAGIWTCGINSSLTDPQKLANSRPDFSFLNMNELARFFS
jgi:phosphoglycolate phosphatase